MRDRTLCITWYEKYPDLRPGVQYFDCDRLSASLTHDACRQNWIAAHRRSTDETPLRLLKCRSCPVGRLLHTDSDAPQTWLDVRAANECLRCGRRDLRLIPSSGICVSCWNREREGRLNKDARGNIPKTRIVLSQRRVGLIIDGKPTWRRFEAYHEGEAISRAIRQIDGAKLHDQQPGNIIWNPRVKRYQYRCNRHPGEFGTLVAHQCDDGIETYHCPVCTPQRARDLPEAHVCSSTSIQSLEYVREVMRTFCFEPIESWKATDFVCDRCSHYALQVRTIGGKLQCRCPLCDVQH